MKKTVLFLVLAVTFFAATSCTTVKDIPQDLSAPQLLQRGQACEDNGDYKNAEIYYLTTLERYGEDTNTYIETKYELGHLYMKKKNYSKAYEAFDEILEIYSYAMAGDLPGSYKKLAQIEIDKIPPAKLEELQSNKPL